MTISNKLQQFYKDHNLPLDGGYNSDSFELKFKLFSLKLPNSQLRKEVIHIHDIQHILYNCDISWKGEAFIAGWEIATGFWKKFPIGLMSLWAMGFSFLNYPKEVYKGYKAGIQVTGIFDLNLNKSELLALTLDDLKKKITKKTPVKMNFIQWSLFIFWILVSQVIFFFPLLIPIILYLIY